MACFLKRHITYDSLMVHRACEWPWHACQLKKRWFKKANNNSSHFLQLLYVIARIEWKKYANITNVSSLYLLTNFACKNWRFCDHFVSEYWRGGKAERERVVLLQLPWPEVRHRVQDQPGDDDRVLESYRKRPDGGGSGNRGDCRDEEDAGVL